jgi:cyclopropane fatty-acyl-phospholipid synthase-like methyltransferase
MKGYKKIIYENYISNYNKDLYGENTLSKIKAHFPSLKHYYARHVPSNKDAHILDIGCGDGGFVYCLQQMGYTNVSGVDFSAEQVAKGRSMGIANLCCADITEFLTESTVRYDAIIAKDVIEHFTKDEVFELLALISKNLKDGGRFIMQVPNGQGLFYTSVFYGDYTHEMAYTESSVNQIIRNTGFKSSTCYPTGPIPYNVPATVRFIFWRLKVAQLRFWKMIETGKWGGIFTQNIIAVIEK